MIIYVDAVIPYIHPSQIYNVFENELMNQTEWNPYCEQILKVPDKQVYCTRIRMPMVSNREFVDEKIQFVDDGKWYVIFRDAQDLVKHDFKTPKGYVRGSCVMNGY